jgi:DNA-binding NtrC family response regulator
VTEISSERPPHPGRSERILTILVVEDDLSLRAMLLDYLEEQGFAVFEAGDAMTAIQLISYGDFTLDAVITDIRMPGHIDGIELIEWLRLNRPGLPIIITSGTCTAEIAQASADNAFFFSKPYDCIAVGAKAAEMIVARG